MWPYTVFRYDRHGDTPPARVGSACSVIATSVKLHMGRQPQERMGSVSFTMHVRHTVKRHNRGGEPGRALHKLAYRSRSRSRSFAIPARRTTTGPEETHRGGRRRHRNTIPTGHQLYPPRRTCCQQQAIVNGHIKQAASILRANVLFMVLDPFTVHVGLVCGCVLKRSRCKLKSGSLLSSPGPLVACAWSCVRAFEFRHS